MEYKFDCDGNLRDPIYIFLQGVKLYASTFFKSLNESTPNIPLCQILGT